MTNRRKYIFTQPEVCIWDLLLQEDIQGTENKQRFMMIVLKQVAGFWRWHCRGAEYATPKFITLAAVQKDTLTLFCLPESMWSVSSLCQEDRRHPYCQRWGIAWEGSINKPCYFLTYPKPKLQLVNSSQIYYFLCLKGIKAVCFGHFLDHISMRPLYI